MKKLWDTWGWVISIYMVYRQLQTTKEMRNDIYQTLPPEQQQAWDSIFGKPVITQNTVQPLTLPGVPVPVPNNQATVNQLKSGT